MVLESIKIRISMLAWPDPWSPPRNFQAYGVRDDGDRRYIVFQIWDFDGDAYVQYKEKVPRYLVI